MGGRERPARFTGQDTEAQSLTLDTCCQWRIGDPLGRWDCQG